MDAPAAVLGVLHLWLAFVAVQVPLLLLLLPSARRLSHSQAEATSRAVSCLRFPL